MTMFRFLYKIAEQSGMYRLYIQGKRQSENHFYVDELGRPLNFFQWDKDGSAGLGNYLRINYLYEMETSTGLGSYDYVCQLRLK